MKFADLPVLPAPVVLPAQSRAPIEAACARVRSALIRIAGPDRWNPAVPMPDGLQSLVASESLALERLGICRFDALCDADGGHLAFLEVQAGDPSGAGWTDAIAEQMGLTHHTPLVAPRRARLPPSVERIAVVNEDQSFVVSDTELMAQLLGRGARRIDPSRFEWDGARLTCDGVRYDAVLRDSHEELTLAPDRTRALRAALEAGLPRLNPFRDVWFDDKASFALLWAQRASLPADERAAVDAHVPETFLVAAADLPRLRAEREAWVLKPAVGYGGFGVVLGHACDAAAWDRALAEATSRRTVAQRRLAAARQGDRYVTYSFWLHGGSLAGGFARAGTQPVVNVHQGGGIGPLIWGEP